MDYKSYLITIGEFVVAGKNNNMAEASAQAINHLLPSLVLTAMNEQEIPADLVGQGSLRDRIQNVIEQETESITDKIRYVENVLNSRNEDDLSREEKMILVGVKTLMFLLKIQQDDLDIDSEQKELADYMVKLGV